MLIETRPCTGQILQDSAVPYPDLVRRVLSARGINSAEEMDFTLRRLHPVHSLRGVQAAAALLAEAVVGRRNILIVGDYDADGATATALCIQALHLFGHQQVDFLVPDRFKYGYGLTPDIVELAQAYQPWLLMTVDNGVSSIEGVEAARACGYKTLITDHHLPGQRLPDCDVMVNPNQPGDDFPSRYLAGVGVAFYVMLALRQELLARDYFRSRQIPEPRLTGLLDLVALGTVADVVPLDANNRILVERGLQQIRAGYGCPGILALLHVAGKNPQQVVSSDFGFACGPRLNAAGRLADMAVGIRCLLASDSQEAMRLAWQLNTLNDERRQIEAGMKDDAGHIIQSLGLDKSGAKLPPIMCLHQPDWHEGVIGILASRIKDRFYRPVIAFANAENGMVKGSARCIPGLHMRDLIDEVASLHPGLISRFGGHAMAAGLTLPAERLDEFARIITAVVHRHAQHDTFHEVLLTDGELSADEISLANAELLRDLAPWGQWFPEPLFSGRFILLRVQILKDLHVKAQLRPLEGTQSIIALDFFADLQHWPVEGSELTLVYKLAVNEFRGRRELQLLVEHISPGV